MKQTVYAELNVHLRRRRNFRNVSAKGRRYLLKRSYGQGRWNDACEWFFKDKRSSDSMVWHEKHCSFCISYNMTSFNLRKVSFTNIKRVLRQYNKCHIFVVSRNNKFCWQFINDSMSQYMVVYPIVVLVFYEFLYIAVFFDSTSLYGTHLGLSRHISSALLF